MAEQRQWFFEMKSSLGEDAMKMTGRTAKDLEYYIDLVDKAAAGFERIDSNFERNSTAGKMLSSSITCYRDIIHKRKSQSMEETSLFSFSKCHSRPNLQQPAP